MTTSKSLSPKCCFQLIRYLLLQRDARIEHDAQQSDHLQVAVEIRVNLLDRVDQIGQAFEREILALHRDDHAVGGAQTVQREQRQSRRAIDEDEIVFGFDFRQRLAQHAFAVFHADQFNLGARQFAVGRQDVVADRICTSPRFELPSPR